MIQNLDLIKKQIQYNSNHIKLLQKSKDLHEIRIAARNLSYLLEQAEKVKQLEKEKEEAFYNGYVKGLKAALNLA